MLFLSKLFSLGGEIIKHVGELDRNQWLMVFGVCVVIGFFCMRGFGSRKNY